MSETESDNQSFSGIRSLIWPIHRYELKKLIPMLFMFFLITFNYNVLRTLKDTLVLTAKASGAEVIPFIKVWAMFPGAILMTLLFTKLSNRFKRETVFYIIFSLFLCYFFVFTYFIHPYAENFHLHGLANFLEQILPGGCKGLIAMLRYWSFTTFYVMSELWSPIILFMLFWGFANQITGVQEAKRFYGLFSSGGNFSGIVAGQVSVYCSYCFSWQASMQTLVGLILLSGIIVIILFRWMNKVVLTDPCYYDPKEAIADKKIRGKLSLKDSFSYLLKSKYLIYLTIIVIAYNVVINLVEVVWKHHLLELYPDPKDFNLYINEVSTIIGVVSTFAALFISGNSLRKFGWTFTAILTPLILLLTSLAFFGVFFCQKSLLTALSPLPLIVFIGTCQNVLSRGAKYTVFDATKEMAFVPLSAEDKLKGQAAIDGVCNRFGKSGGSMIHQSLLITFGGFAGSAPYVAVILFSIIGVWMYAVRYVGVEFNGLTSKHESSVKREDTKDTAYLIQQGVA